MKTIILTRHARARMAQYGLPEAAVVAAVRHPLWTEPDPRPGVERRFGRPPELDGRVLRVACVEENDHIRVLSAFPDRDARPPDGA
ncbi:DUF4258 domain-containing protein [uncultured Brevundimonas sp.]|uniref:DUF4258 domain-containing protein n=1 Tax=uncultured Brevundimonas sp. TaxID=213418 RepID=UPI002639AF58|nr:DUF4258 domain-containing protein [uncultured Brevundimonas sp.]